MTVIVETIRPTVSQQDTAGGGYVLDEALAYDASAATSSRVIAESAGQHGAQILSAMPADSYPAARTSVVLRVWLARLGFTAADRAVVAFRAAHANPWTVVAQYFMADLGTVSTLKTIDVTALAGSAPATGFETAVQFLNDVVGTPELPLNP